MKSPKIEEGKRIRSEVLGKAYTDKSALKMDDFAAPMTELVMEYCWGTVWARPGLPRKIRSLITVGILAALNRSHELKTHMRGGINNGCTKEEILEVVLQAAIYCGVPAGAESVKAMKEVLSELEQEKILK